MRRSNVIAYSVAAIIAAVLVLGALTMIRVVGFNTDPDFSVETVEEYARWCGRMGDPVAKELDKGRGVSGWGNIAESLVAPIREAEAIDPAPNGLEEFHKAKLASLKGMSDLARDEATLPIRRHDRDSEGSRNPRPIGRGTDTSGRGAAA